MNTGYSVEPEQAFHRAAVEDLHAAVFGPDRKSRTVSYLRRMALPVPDLDRVAVLKGAPADGQVIGSIRYCAVALGRSRLPAVLLGPVVVAPEWRAGSALARANGLNVARDLIGLTLERAGELGYEAVILKAACAELVPYYERYGFSRSVVAGLRLPDLAARAENRPTDTVRIRHESTLLMGLELTPGIMAGLRGAIHARLAVPAPHRFRLPPGPERAVSRL